MQGMFIGGRCVEIRSLRVQDGLGSWRRYRVCSTDGLNERFTKKPAVGRLVKDENSRTGIAIRPKGAGFVKVGKNAAVQPVIIASLAAVSKKQRNKLLKQVAHNAYEGDGGVWFEVQE